MRGGLAGLLGGGPGGGGTFRPFSWLFAKNPDAGGLGGAPWGALGGLAGL